MASLPSDFTKIQFRPGLVPGPRWGERRPPSWWGGGSTLPYPTPASAFGLVPRASGCGPSGLAPSRFSVSMRWQPYFSCTSLFSSFHVKPFGDCGLVSTTRKMNAPNIFGTILNIFYIPQNRGGRRNLMTEFNSNTIPLSQKCS